ncbi:hypothetical protein [Bacillus atrophaeus]|uniref:hypothetical protein n=1 Tax=Bacillus atrophaeus TaxID=1452 RepID=UPI00227F8DDC|nr:hypothetical protein [Bacillus atrophaeus]MCY8478082.1 hypothetical protein [Bacillus atrophaeus]MED1018569.1 hypothetical protein [Bacillus atrophaeus]MED1032542.1 hypothetical protein [Bacillus atrophaeus]MED1121055.1 hypothetical protein [Bacillus atrophaeus]
MNIKLFFNDVKTLSKEFLDKHWITILAVVVLILSCYMYLYTFSVMLLPFMFVPMWYISAIAFSNHKMHKSINGFFRKDKTKEFTILRVYTNDQNFSERMTDADYLATQSIDSEKGIVNTSKDIPSQIPYYVDEEFRYCYHLLIDDDNNMYIAGQYQNQEVDQIDD